MRTVGKDSEACHAAELPEGRLRTAAASHRETDWTRHKLQRPPQWCVCRRASLLLEQLPVTTRAVQRGSCIMGPDSVTSRSLEAREDDDSILQEWFLLAGRREHACAP